MVGTEKEKVPGPIGRYSPVRVVEIGGIEDAVHLRIGDGGRGAMQRKRYSAEFKREAVKLASQAGMVKRQVAQELGIHENLLRSWIRQIAAGKWEAARIVAGGASLVRKTG